MNAIDANSGNATPSQAGVVETLRTALAAIRASHAAADEDLLAEAAVNVEQAMEEITKADAEQHVAIAERYPLLQAPDWTQRAAVKVGKLLDAMPAKERKRIVGLCEQQRAHAIAAEKMVANWAQFDDEARDRLWTLAHSKDEREQTFAVRFLADLTPSQDPRIHDLGDAAQSLRRAAARFDGDPLNDRLQKMADVADDLVGRLREQHAARIKKLAAGLEDEEQAREWSWRSLRTCLRNTSPAQLAAECMNRGVWSQSDDDRLLMRQRTAEVRDICNETLPDGLPAAQSRGERRC